MYERILVPTDGSDGTERAVEHALAAAGEGTTLHVLSVVDRRIYLSADKADQDAVLDRLHERAESAVERAVDAVGDGVDVIGEVREGVPHAEIGTYADDHDIDLVVIGSHGRTGREKIVNLGSVTERVVSSVGRPVLVVDIGPEDAAGVDSEVSVEDGAEAGEAEEAD
jgi:nucleotide-binding universal stress UspA family protein